MRTASEHPYHAANVMGLVAPAIHISRLDGIEVFKFTDTPCTPSFLRGAYEWTPYQGERTLANGRE